ncbi:hypothetical protein QFZ84_003206 [Pseudomonas fluorescens]
MDVENQGQATLNIGEFAALFLTLQSDINQIYPFEEHADSNQARYPDPTYLLPGARRGLVRATFAFIEGNSYFLRQILLRSWGDKLPAATRLALAETQIEVNSQGNVKTKPLRSGATSMLRLTIETFISIFPNVLNVRCAGPSFESLTRSVRVRDRLMHPKSAAALMVTDQETRDIVEAFHWFSSVMVDIIKASNRALKDQLQQEFGIEVSLVFERKQPSN